MDRRKELKQLYKNTKPDMGIFTIKSNFNNKCYLEGNQNLKGTINSTRFKLELGNHTNKELQEQWKEHGESSFTMEVLEKLEYDEDETIVDYSEDLNILKMIWGDRLSEKGLEFYKR